MIDMITIAGTIGYRHSPQRSGGKAEEDRFYAEFGNNSLIGFIAWLTSLDLNLGRRHKAAAQSCGTCGCAVQAALLAPR
ncbi:hypothetical protein ACC764_16295 [Rhizobium ruizarguesonis]|uniref:hypothetical protein n=1 Tax=Rhizobium ruizarguesonis TaxID=2081791 RepID=UPI0010320AF7|nr:hypothetical protein [Rhizobium ruizarguesonis]TAZ97697.1 hypothetical protein ELH67_02155 [Rhizobium ruizarguesonis]TBA40582.1 hypothetical protein ELH60_02155 [Rhizobium ruizarguesonis]TBC66133.1 hypothetical protein ELH36_02150 [Rhizobium ruizarguesonis]WSH23148.1 hypothetical protein U8Q07_04340 [Rhizobium ruizarguesonis]WSH36100.1 hypothetical protein U8P70_04335 [Rhizobium ruizarguesonis]